MFSKKIVTVIELSDQTKQALAQLDTDMQVLEELTREVIANQQKVLAALTGEISKQVPVEEPPGIQVFEDEQMDIEDEAEVSSERPRRSSPFARRPRHEQITWLMSIVSDGRWHTPVLIAKSSGNDSNEVRYLARSIQGRMREMHEDGVLDRRSSKVPGAMFDYKLRRK